MPIPKGYRFTDKPKNFVLRIRMSEDELTELTDFSNRTGLSMSELVRKGLKMLYSELKK